MGDGAGPHSVAARPQPGGVAGRYRRRSRQFCAVDAVDRRTGGDFLEVPPGGVRILSAVIARSEATKQCSFFVAAQEAGLLLATRCLAMTIWQTMCALAILSAQGAAP